ncbi:MAG TPA: dihydroxyacetone kinase subunit DhaK [Bryobacteraceae bacterium]|nr:dihydroxyacetone kinase subunit DhaK [Bryobacteraceae bacterium]
MKKLINDPNRVREELFEGFLAAYGKQYNLIRVGEGTVAVRRDIPDGRVAVLTGGGSGHEPLFLGALGPGMADAAVCGDIFSAPSPDLIVAGAGAVHRGAGVCMIHGNYAGDNMNFRIACEMLAEEGIPTFQLRVWDDIASAPPARKEERRGMTADVFLIKIAGALAERGASLAGMVPVIERAREYCRTLGVALTSATVPQTGKPTFEIGESEMEIGIGMHGEPGVGREPMASADSTCRRMIDRMVADLPFRAGDEVLLLVNSMGATTYMELYIMARAAHRVLAEYGISVHATHAGPFFTCQEMAGCMITLMKLDEELKSLYHAPAHSPDYFLMRALE